MFSGRVPMGVMQRAKQNPSLDHAESVIVSHVALIKMLRHCKQGIPIEVMGLLLGTFVDKYTVYVSDCFSMPQVGQADSVDSVDEVFQAEMMEMLKKVNVPENCVGWYHSHPGYFAWLSHIDQNTHKSFERLDYRSIAIVLDPMNSTSGKLVIEAFRLIPGASMGLSFGISFGSSTDTRVITSDKGFMRPKNPTSLLRGLDKQFYAMPLTFSMLGYERVMLSKLASTDWVTILCGTGHGLTIDEESKADDRATHTVERPSDFEMYADRTPLETLQHLQSALKLATTSNVSRPCEILADKLRGQCFAQDFSLTVFSHVMGTPSK
ncbi:Non ATPase subunit MPR1 of 26S proteasome [Giardia duodenalis]|uniref:Non ATPase subunit MPR1 of 26S proteasome n=1 Tax=Giardia intestinalis (strain ATCC 50803 / WB clone C6) TaxID=184922 RepID=A0A644F416_GIAIC|nr:Non ATPase subunit MPR1 of 26S proteasome [Giardia intestinalis]KAE8303367.1 Non ATPase subunit MPR1 of 26S proteasome [Giardia intestinalis]